MGTSWTNEDTGDSDDSSYDFRVRNLYNTANEWSFLVDAATTTPLGSYKITHTPEILYYSQSYSNIQSCEVEVTVIRCEIADLIYNAADFDDLNSMTLELWSNYWFRMSSYEQPSTFPNYNCVYDLDFSFPNL